MTTPFSFRGFHHDLARGNYDSLPSLRRLIQFMSECGLNQLVLYMEDLWRYQKHPQLSNAHAYEPQEIGEMARYAATLGIDLIPSLTTLGHSHHILQKPDYSHLAFPGKRADFDVNNEKVYALFADLFDEVLPHFQSPYVFLNGDEVNHSSLSEEAKKQARRDGIGSLFGKGMARLAQMICERGKRPILWHDMLLHHPEAIEYLPPETIICYWYYDFARDYPALQVFADAGFDVIAAPGVFRSHMFIDYARVLPNIQGQSQAAARVQSAHGKCLGTLLTSWEDVTWSQTALGIYAAGRWAQNPETPREQVLREFAPDVFQLDEPHLGQSWMEGTRELGRLALRRAAWSETRSDEERSLLETPLSQTRERLQTFLRAAEHSQPTRNADIHSRMADAARMAVGFDGAIAPRVAAPPLLSTALISADDKSCRIARGSTPWGHELIVLANETIAVALLPQFAGVMIEWVLLGENWSFIPSNYSNWASGSHLELGDPGLLSPWATTGIGGWRECIFYNTRLNPSSLWGRTFEVKVLHESPEKISIECRGENEVAHIKRTITLSRNSNRIAIETTATNKRGECFLAIQPNVPHVFPNACAAALNLVQWHGKEKQCRPLIDHDGTKHFAPLGDSLRIESPLTGHFLQLDFDREQTSLFLTDCLEDVFTLEPQGRVLHREAGEAVTMRLEYELGVTH